MLRWQCAIAAVGVTAVLAACSGGSPPPSDTVQQATPSASIDQVGATLMQWLGLPASEFHAVFPDLANFSQKTIPLMRT